MVIVNGILAIAFLIWFIVGFIGLIMTLFGNAFVDGYITYEGIKAKKDHDILQEEKVKQALKKHRRETFIEAIQWFIWPYYAIRRKGFFTPHPGC